MANRNKNGSYDYGVAQINSAWLGKTRMQGVDAKALQNNACTNLWVAGWIIRRCMAKFNTSFWHAVGCYHVGENAKRPDQFKRQMDYAVKVRDAANRSRASFLAWLQGGPR